MKTILAVDLKKGKVVKAFAGFRLNYKPLIINNIDFSDPCKLINFVVKEINLKTVYLADLDSISNLLPNMDTIEKILKKFPQINFLIDCGFNYPASINKFYSIFEKKGRHKNQYIGRSIYNQSVFTTSETNLINKITNAKITNSTDFALESAV